MSDQRKQPDRRNENGRRRGDRRRGVDLRRPAIEICRSMLHLVKVVNDDEGEPKDAITRSVRWRNKSTSLLTDEGMQELGDAFRILVAEEKLVGAEVRITLNGELCVTRIASGASDEVRQELSECEERSRHYLSLGPGAKAMASSIHQLDARHQHALLTVANHRTLEVISTIADEAGIQVVAIEPSLVALVRSHAMLKKSCSEPSLLIQLDERGAELGVCCEGKLLLEYRPGGRAASANIAAIVGEHISRLERYLGRQHGCSGTQLKKIYLTGDPGPVGLAKAKFQELGRFEVDVLEPSQLDFDCQYSEETFGGEGPGTEFSAAFGSVLAFYGDTKSQSGPNLVDYLKAKTRLPMRPVLMRSAIPLAAVLLIAVGLAVYNLFLSMTLGEMTAELEQLAPIQMRAKELRLKLGATNAMLTQLRAIDEQVQDYNWPLMLSRIAQSLPKDVWLNRLEFNDSATGSLNGSSHHDVAVYDMVGHLERVPELGDIALEGTGLAQSSSGPTTMFDVVFSVAVNVDSVDEGSRDD